MTLQQGYSKRKKVFQLVIINRYVTSRTALSIPEPTHNPVYKCYLISSVSCEGNSPEAR